LCGHDIGHNSKDNLYLGHHYLLLRGFYKTLILLEIGRKFPHSTARQRQVIVQGGREERRLWKSSEGSNLLATF